MTFRGSLAEVTLADVLQLVAVSSRTGILSLRRAEERGEIHIDQGQISHAATGQLSGDLAFYELARWTLGEFEFAQDAPLGPRTVDKPNPALLEEAIRQASEWRVMATKIPSTRVVPVLIQQAATGVSLAADEWAIVSRVDERRNLEEIAAALGQSTFAICKVVYRLLTTGVLALREDSPQLPLERLRRGETERPAARVERRVIDLGSARQRLSELVYRGLGPNGETHVVKIEKTKSIEQLIKVGTASRDFLLKLGRRELADQVSAELENLQ